jgi:hypothetical protein
MGARVVRIEQDAALGKAAAIYTAIRPRGSRRGRRARVRGAAGRAKHDRRGSGLSGEAAGHPTGRCESSTKVLARTARRFWEADEGIYGGGTFTDLPIGISYYPADNAEARTRRFRPDPASCSLHARGGSRHGAGRVVPRGAVSSRHREPGQDSSPVAAAGDGAADRELQLGYESLQPGRALPVLPGQHEDYIAI